MARYELQLNGHAISVESDDASKPLLYVLRGLGLNAAKFGCGLGQCGACTVLIDGRATRACQTTIADAAGRAVTTLEGLGSSTNPHPIQTAFIKEQVPQCGYCTSGIIMTAAGLLAQNKKPTEADIRQELDGNLCRCGSHPRVVRAIMTVVQGA